MVGPPVLEEGDSRLERAVEQLPSASRTIVRLRYTDGLRFEEIGSRLGVGPATVRSRHRRALEQLRRSLADTPSRKGRSGVFAPFLRWLRDRTRRGPARLAAAGAFAVFTLACVLAALRILAPDSSAERGSDALDTAPAVRLADTGTEPLERGPETSAPSRVAEAVPAPPGRTVRVYHRDQTPAADIHVLGIGDDYRGEAKPIGRTAANGELPVPPGVRWVFAEHDEFGRTNVTQVLDDPAVGPIPLLLGPLTREIRGRVLAPSGVPVPSAVVELEVVPRRGLTRMGDGRYVAPIRPSVVRTDRRGRFSCKLGRSVRDVSVVARAGGRSSAPRTVRVASPGTMQYDEVEIRLRKDVPPPRQPVHVRSASGAPVRNATVYFDLDRIGRHHIAAVIEGVVRGEDPLQSDPDGILALDSRITDDSILALTLREDPLHELLAFVRAGDLGGTWSLPEGARPRARRAVDVGLPSTFEVYAAGATLAHAARFQPTSGGSTLAPLELPVGEYTLFGWDEDQYPLRTQAVVVGEGDGTITAELTVIDTVTVRFEVEGPTHSGAGLAVVAGMRPEERGARRTRYEFFGRSNHRETPYTAQLEMTRADEMYVRLRGKHCMLWERIDLAGHNPSQGPHVMKLKPQFSDSVRYRCDTPEWTRAKATLEVFDRDGQLVWYTRRRAPTAERPLLLPRALRAHSIRLSAADGQAFEYVLDRSPHEAWGMGELLPMTPSTGARD